MVVIPWGKNISGPLCITLKYIQKKIQDILLPHYFECSLCIRNRTSNLKMLLPKTKIVFYCCKTLREIEYNNRKILHSWPIFCEEVFPLWQNYQTIIWSWKMEMAAEGPRGWRFFFRSCTLFKYKRRHEEWDQWIRLGQDRRIARWSKTHF